MNWLMTLVNPGEFIVSPLFCGISQTYMDYGVYIEIYYGYSPLTKRDVPPCGWYPWFCTNWRITSGITYWCVLRRVAGWVAGMILDS